MTQFYKITLLSLSLLMPHCTTCTRIEKNTEEKKLAAHYDNIESITIYAVSNDGKAAPTAFKIITADGKVIIVKPNGKKHKKPYAIGSLQGNVENGKLSCPLPQTPWYEGNKIYELESMRAGNEKHARVALLKNGETTLAIIEVLDDNGRIQLLAQRASDSPALFTNNRSFLKEVAHRLPNQLYLKAAVGYAAKRMLHQKQ